jgi:hypothetical protein
MHKTSKITSGMQFTYFPNTFFANCLLHLSWYVFIVSGFLQSNLIAQCQRLFPYISLKVHHIGNVSNKISGLNKLYILDNIQIFFFFLTHIRSQWPVTVSLQRLRVLPRDLLPFGWWVIICLVIWLQSILCTCCFQLFLYWSIQIFCIIYPFLYKIDEFDFISV